MHRAPRRRFVAFSALAVAVAGCGMVLGLGDHRLSVKEGAEGPGDAPIAPNADSFCALGPKHFFCADFDNTPPKNFGADSLNQSGSVDMSFGDAAVSPPASLQTTAPALTVGQNA